MPQADSPALRQGQPQTDLLIVGAGVMGLWAGLHAERLGIPATVVEARRPGAGASGGLLGALMPHMPDRWNDKKQFQFDALLTLEAEIAALEAATGLSAGYRRCGRLIPLAKPHLRRLAEGHMREAATLWKAEGRSFGWNVVDQPPLKDWIDPGAGEHGFVYDTLAGRLAPRALIAALTAHLQAGRHVRLLTDTPVTAIDVERRRAVIHGTDFAFSKCIMAAGHQSFPLLQPFGSMTARSLGQPVKGQSALLQADIDPAVPAIFRDGLYIVAHEGGHVAVGSTSEDSFDSPDDTDERLDTLIEAARDLVPALKDAPVIERWAGLRPKAIDRDPMIGPHPTHPWLFALTGGFKVSFGLAHRLAEAAVQMAAGHALPFPVPASFQFSHHLDIAER
ncbi:NAD(P)/FAD-dependent oxidoreductase [Oryzifoliimicrobium ureilyticus]|uniref:NAD(P)/FAD-dependent oxidoreductase n=1 Tax=Oryzifoliimicrobium ureilyticus TaxID=3113724 RepID=UPI003076244F